MIRQDNFQIILKYSRRQHPLVKILVDTYLVCVLWPYFRNFHFEFFSITMHEHYSLIKKQTCTHMLLTYYRSLVCAKYSVITPLPLICL